ncbi:MAG: hypothetical protein PHU77_00280 [Simplicispira sp.]|nr:hypothetical protein [Simplicispira sp.]
MKWAATLIAIAALIGCAAPAPYTAPTSDLQKSVYISRADATNVRNLLIERRRTLATASTSADIDSFKKEVAELEARLAALEKSIAEQELAISRSTTYTPGGTGTVHTGPRGGRYTITPSGNKSYIRRK